MNCMNRMRWMYRFDERKNTWRTNERDEKGFVYNKLIMEYGQDMVKGESYSLWIYGQNKENERKENVWRHKKGKMDFGFIDIYWKNERMCFAT